MAIGRVMDISFEPVSDPHEVAQFISIYIHSTKLWELTAKEHSRLLDVPVANWVRMKRGIYRGRLGQDKVMRIKFVVSINRALTSAGLSHWWLLAHNAMPAFSGTPPLKRIEDEGIPGMEEVLACLSNMAQKKSS